MKRSVSFGLAALGALSLIAAAFAQTAAPPALYGNAPSGDAAAPVAGAPGAAPVATAAPRAVNGPRHFVVKGIRGGRPVDAETVKFMEQDRDLASQVAEAAAQFRSETDESVRTELQSKIATLVAEQFDIRQALRQRELEELSAQIVRLRNLHDQRAAQKERIVADRINQLMRDAEGLGWGDDSAGVAGALKFKWEGGGGPWPVPVPGEPGPLEARLFMSGDAAELPVLNEYRPK